MVRVVLVDDEPLVRAGLAALVGAEPDMEVVGEAEDGAQVAGVVARCVPDVVLMDVRMPRLDGIEATRALMRAPVPPKVIVVTTFDSDQYVYGALRAGAQGFVLKRSRPEDILAAVRVVHAGESLLFPSAIRALAQVHAGADGPRARAVAALSEREAQVLVLMARGLSNTEIAGEVFLGVETVKTHVSSILAKLGVRDRTQAVIAAYDSGLVGLNRG
ncbi:response regulator [Nocardiopsis salina]|uniref:response regulator n=1 Tax=Nocardiopsis salina TaxID=245836 RepID=UPI000475649D|nr:response regulator transcription factor [Nocardiopsis salina]